MFVTPNFGWSLQLPVQPSEGEDVVLAYDGITNIAALWSPVRRTRSSYTGPLMRVRRESDSSEIDIGYNSSNMLDTASLSSHCFGTKGRVSILYDQSGNGYNLTQATAVRQPIIYLSGSVVVLNNLPGLFFESATNCRINRTDSCGITGSSPYTAFFAHDANLFGAYTALSFGDNSVHLYEARLLTSSSILIDYDGASATYDVTDMSQPNYIISKLDGGDDIGNTVVIQNELTRSQTTSINPTNKFVVSSSVTYLGSGQNTRYFDGIISEAGLLSINASGVVLDELNTAMSGVLL